MRSGSREGPGRDWARTDERYCSARYYHPGLQRFISEDPLEVAAGDTNLYVYVDNRPTDFVDPTGLYAIVDDVLFSVGGGVVGLIGQGVGDWDIRKYSRFPVVSAGARASDRDLRGPACAGA